MIRTAFLPAAGLGRRLRPLTDRVPKPLLPAGGESLLVQAMKSCADAGAKRFIVNTHHQPEAFERAFPERNWNGIPIDFIYEPVLLETGTGLRNVYETLDLNEPILIFNGDILTDFPVQALLRDHERRGRPVATLAASPTGPQLHVIADDNGGVIRFDRSATESPHQRFQYLGVAVVEPELIPFIRDAPPESLVSGWSRALQESPGSVRIHSVRAGRWADAGTLSLYLSLKEKGLDAPGVIDLTEGR